MLFAKVAPQMFFNPFFFLESQLQISPTYDFFAKPLQLYFQPLLMEIIDSN
jgi:hypothetical protein